MDKKLFLLRISCMLNILQLIKSPGIQNHNKNIAVETKCQNKAENTGWL